MRVIGGLSKSIINDKDNQIPIPYYMKANLGFEPGTDVYFFIPQDKKELILSPINPFYWRGLLKINLILKERAGAVEDTLALIKGANALIEGAKAFSAITETVTTEVDGKHEATVIFSLVKDNNEENIILDEEMGLIKKRIREKFDGKFHDDFVTYEHKEISRLEYLPRLWELLEPERTANEKNNDKYMGKIQKGWVEIPIIYQEQLKEFFDTSKFFLYSDTEEKYIKYLFLEDSYTLYWLDIYYSRITFLELSFRFFKKNNINIFGSYSLPKKGIYGVYSVILQLNKYLSENNEISNEKLNSQQILKTLMRDLKDYIKSNLKDYIKKEDNTHHLKNEVQSGLCFRGKIYTPIVGAAGKIDYPPEEIIV